MKNNYILFAFAFILFLGCGKQEERYNKSESLLYRDFYRTDFFKDVQLSGIFEDSKTFVDCIPKKSKADIITNYYAEKAVTGFNLRDFVLENFHLPSKLENNFSADTTIAMQAHISNLWPVLTREKDLNFGNGSLIPLPNQYVVPGGRFREIYYWDSYFTMLGLKAAGKEDLALDMLNNFAFLIDSLGFIPNGNRAYYMGRSQPPFFAFMVDLLAENNRDLYLKYQPYLLKEYQFWMNGSDQLSEQSPTNRRVVRFNSGEVLNRYYDRYAYPRPESFKEDYKLAEDSKLNRGNLYRDLRAGAESGWDYSSRWLADKQNMGTIHTTEIVPVDLNALLYFLELKIAQTYNWQSKKKKSDSFLEKAARRRAAINTVLWNEQAGTYMDYDFINLKHTNVISMAMAYPLFVQIAPKDKARKVIKLMNTELLQPGGLVTSVNDTGQQWDYPNAWAPLQWIGMQSYFHYGFHDEGIELIDRWLTLNEKVYHETGKMMEKYNVVDTTLQAGGGEYELQDGFGWTNGVAVAMQQILNNKEKVKNK
jgi:alpha,alpha-trehalase